MTTTQPTTIPYNGSGTINIHINNPSVNSGMPQYAQVPYYPVYYPYYCYPANYYMNNLNNGGINQTMTINGLSGGANGQQTQNANNNSSSATSASSSAVSKISTPQTKPQKKEIVVLTDDYIKNLENNLRSNNAELRKNATKEVLERFKEDKSRINNPSLTALLNLALQDPNNTVRALAMTIVEAGYAKGDDLTRQLLGSIQTQNKNFKTDEQQAANGLLQMSKVKQTVDDNSHDKNQPIRKGK